MQFDTEMNWATTTDANIKAENNGEEINWTRKM